MQESSDGFRLPPWAPKDSEYGRLLQALNDLGKAKKAKKPKPKKNDKHD